MTFANSGIVVSPPRVAAANPAARGVLKFLVILFIAGVLILAVKRPAIARAPGVAASISRKIPAEDDRSREAERVRLPAFSGNAPEGSR